MKLYTTINDLEFSMSFVNLFIGILVQRFLVLSSTGILLHIASHHFGHLRLPYRSFLLIFSPNLSSFCRRIPYIYCGLLSSPYFCMSHFCIEECNGFHCRTYPFTTQGADSFHLCFLVITTSFNR